MTYLAQVDLGEGYEPFRALGQFLGFLPKLFPAQSLLPRAIEAEAQIAGAVLIQPGALPRLVKEAILLTVAARANNAYCTTAHGRVLRDLGLEETRIVQLTRDHRKAGFSEAETALLDFGVKLARHPTAIAFGDFEALQRQGWTDTQILETVQVTALTRFLCTLSVGLGTPPDFTPLLPAPDPSLEGEVSWLHSSTEAPGPYLARPDVDEKTFPPFLFFRKKFGFIPNIFRAQTLRPHVLEAEAQAVRDILLTEDVLSRVQKEYILLVISAANRNTYCVAVHCEMLRGLGIPEDQSDHIAIDHSQAVLPAADKALLDFALKLATRPAQFGLPDIAGLRNRGFSDEQILEAVVMSALTNFLNTLQMGLGTVADFPPRPAALGLNLSPPPERPMLDTGAHRPGEDPDAGLVERVRNGDFEAFEQIVRRHQGRVYRTLMGVTGNAQDAEDGTQNVFIKVFRKIADFQGAARFSTWLTRIALNEAAERLRTRKDLDRLDERDEEEFRPSRLQPWAEDPESRVAREEMKQIVQEALRRLPVRYRTAVMLRDIEELSTAEAAEALGVPVPTLKTRLLRGRLMLREALAARFIVPRRQTVV